METLTGIKLFYGSILCNFFKTVIINHGPLTFDHHFWPHILIAKQCLQISITPLFVAHFVYCTVGLMICYSHYEKVVSTIQWKWRHWVLTNTIQAALTNTIDIINGWLLYNIFDQLAQSVKSSPQQPPLLGTESSEYLWILSKVN